MWKTVLVYGCLMATSVALYKYLEYQFITGIISREITLSLIALVFTVAGVWFGLKFKESKSSKISLKSQSEVRKDMGLTEREMEVLELLAEGHSNQEIADKLFISLATVKTHSSNLYSKLHVKRRTQAIERARSMGILKVHSEV